MSENTTTHDAHDADQGPRHRVEAFAVTGPVTARITTRSGDVDSSAGADGAVRVSLRASGASAPRLLAESEVRYDEATSTLYVVTAGSSVGASGAGPFGLGFGRRRSALGAALRDVDVEVVLPPRSSLEVTTKSGDLRASGEAGDVEATSASGDIGIDDAASAKVRTASGDVTIARARANATVSTASGDVAVRECAGKVKVESASGDVLARSSGEVTDVATASGDVVVEANRAGRLLVRSASGDVQVAVREGLEIEVVARSVGGTLSSAIPLDATASGEASETLAVTVATVSGDVRIVRA